MGLFNNRENNLAVWFMRQAGRYHDHYQGIRSKNDFMTMCKTPALASEITMGPINDFNFDAAIIFSDLLFPLEYLKMGLHYNEGPPRLAFHLDEKTDFTALKNESSPKDYFDFQKKAVSTLRAELNPNKNLIGFIGAPFTLYTYAVEGSHGGNLIKAKSGLYNGIFSKFMEVLLPVIVQEAIVQIEGGADVISIFDTAAGELSLSDYERFVAPYIRELSSKIKASYPEIKIIYYSKFTQTSYIEKLGDTNIDVIGLDWRNDIVSMLETLGDKYYLQGNIDPSWLFLDWSDLESNLKSYIGRVDKSLYSKWICGLGHGVLPKTPQQNVLKTVEYIHSI
ncbi:uroporphyrinogen decarboxylase [bacterium]|nr:uroporphyrinogen decarboxylase [bacterium]